MNSQEKLNTSELIATNLNNPKKYGLYRRRDGQLVFDRRYTADAIEASGILNPRTADLNLIGPDIIEVPDDIALTLGIELQSDNQV